MVYKDTRSLIRLALQLSMRLPYRALYAKIHDRADAEAAAGSRTWVDTKLSGELGRPDPHRPVERPMNAALTALERRVFEKHNRAAGQDTGWVEFFEAALLAYEADLDREALRLPAEIRRVLERAGYRCEGPHCGRRAMLERHHREHRSALGGDQDSNRCVLCSSHHQAHHAGLLEVAGEAGSGFRFRHRATPGGRWLGFPPGGAAPYDPLERAWDGPTYVREAPDSVYGLGDRAGVIKNRRDLQLRSPDWSDLALPPRLE